MHCRLMIRCSIACAAAAAMLPLIGCGGGAYSSPESTFETAQTASKNKDWNAFCDCLTPQSRDQMAGMMVFSGSMLKGMSAMAALGGPDKAAKAKAAVEKVDAIFKKHGITEEALKKAGESQAKPGAQNMMGNIASMADMVSDKNQFIADMIDAMQEMNDNPDQDPFASKFVDATLENVKIDGDTATASMVDGDKTQNVQFKQVDGQWKLEFNPGPTG